MVDRNFRIYYVDSGKTKVLPVEYDEAIIRYENVARKDREEVVIVRRTSGEEGEYLSSGRVILPPLNLWVYVILRNASDPDTKLSLGRHRLRQY